MYINRIVDINMGPLSKVDISPAFNNDGTPKPLIIVGENGSGKTTFISNIVDAFYEIAEIGYDNVCNLDNKNGKRKYFKVIGDLLIKNDEKYLCSLIKFNNSAEYIYKSKNCSFDQVKEISDRSQKEINWSDNENQKIVYGINKSDVVKELSTSIMCYFGPERYEKPNWMEESYFNDIVTHIDIKNYYSGELTNSIIPNHAGKEVFSWLLDVIVDSRTDVIFGEDLLSSVHIDINTLKAMTISRNNLENIMSVILGEKVYFGLNLRKSGLARFNIKREKDNKTIVPSIESLSTGQLALFILFSTIVKYADSCNINNSIKLEDITGVVVIDEIELHIHSKMQKECLPLLLKFFPKVQFIITSHSPLFLLGMQDMYGAEGFEIYQMPEGRKINAESYSEFEKAYNYFLQTNIYQNDLRQAIDEDKSNDTLIITEGTTDWKHILAAYNELKDMPQYSDLFSGLKVNLFKYEPKNSKKESLDKVEMGNSALAAMCASFEKVNQRRKFIFIADRDDEKTNKKLSSVGKPYKKWNNNVYSFLIPLPDDRKDTPDISIEHLYSDDEIKTEYEIDGIKRRLFMGNEFNENGLMEEKKLICLKKGLCGEKSIKIIDGSSEAKVTDYNNPKVNYALSKNIFAECVLNKEKGFDSFNFSNFIELFKTIKEIEQEEII